MGIGFWYGAGAACANVKGDMDGNGMVEPVDISFLLDCVFLGIGSCDPCFADVDCTDGATPLDVSLLLDNVFLGSTAPPWCGLP